MNSDLTARHRSILLAAAEGRAKVAAGGHPDLTIDGRWCDHGAIADLLRAGLVRPARLAPLGELVPAILTELGLRVLQALAAARSA